MEEEEWVPGQVVRKVRRHGGSWLVLFLFFGCVLLFVFLLARRRPYYDRSCRPGLRNGYIKQLPPMPRHRRSRFHSLLAYMQRNIKYSTHIHHAVLCKPNHTLVVKPYLKEALCQTISVCHTPYNKMTQTMSPKILYHSGTRIPVVLGPALPNWRIGE